MKCARWKASAAKPNFQITENGASYSDGPAADGRRRLDYLRSHLMAAHSALWYRDVIARNGLAPEGGAAGIA
jgi:beta-glucosidase/6-phospho-beta-glucosidase/beta-galactosidase